MKIYPFVSKICLAFIFPGIFCHSLETFPNNAKNDEIQKIDQEMIFLNEELKKMRKKALNKELQAQPYMIDNWHEFAEEIKIFEENEKTILRIKEKIKELSKKRDSLTPKKTPST